MQRAGWSMCVDHNGDDRAIVLSEDQSDPNLLDHNGRKIDRGCNRAWEFILDE